MVNSRVTKIIKSIEAQRVMGSWLRRVVVTMMAEFSRCSATYPWTTITAEIWCTIASTVLRRGWGIAGIVKPTSEAASSRGGRCPTSTAKIVVSSVYCVMIQSSGAVQLESSDLALLGDGVHLGQEDGRQDYVTN